MRPMLPIPDIIMWSPRPDRHIRFRQATLPRLQLAPGPGSCPSAVNARERAGGLVAALTPRRAARRRGCGPSRPFPIKQSLLDPIRERESGAVISFFHRV